MASLVQGAYILERDRHHSRHGLDAHAPAWWKFYHFELWHMLVDLVDSSIFGVVYAFHPLYHLLDPAVVASSPHYVIAFRGTITKKGSASRDLQLNLQLIRNGLEHSSLFHAATKNMAKVLLFL